MIALLESMKSKVFWIFRMIVRGTIFATSAIAVFLAANYMGEPYSLVSSYVLNPEVRPDGTLLINLVADRKRECPVIITREIFDRETMRKVHEQVDRGWISSLGRNSVIVKLILPNTLGVGQYVYRSTVQNKCGVLGGTYINRNPDQRFEITERAEKGDGG